MSWMGRGGGGGGGGGAERRGRAEGLRVDSSAGVDGSDSFMSANTVTTPSTTGAALQSHQFEKIGEGPEIWVGGEAPEEFIETLEESFDDVPLRPYMRTQPMPRGARCVQVHASVSVRDNGCGRKGKTLIALVLRDEEGDIKKHVPLVCITHSASPLDHSWAILQREVDGIGDIVTEGDTWEVCAIAYKVKGFKVTNADGTTTRKPPSHEYNCDITTAKIVVTVGGTWASKGATPSLISFGPFSKRGRWTVTHNDKDRGLQMLELGKPYEPFGFTHRTYRRSAGIPSGTKPVSITVKTVGSCEGEGNADVGYARLLAALRNKKGEIKAFEVICTLRNSRSRNFEVTLDRSSDLITRAKPDDYYCLCMLADNDPSHLIYCDFCEISGTLTPTMDDSRLASPASPGSRVSSLRVDSPMSPLARSVAVRGASSPLKSPTGVDVVAAGRSLLAKALTPRSAARAATIEDRAFSSFQNATSREDIMDALKALKDNRSRSLDRKLIMQAASDLRSKYTDLWDEEVATAYGSVLGAYVRRDARKGSMKDQEGKNPESPVRAFKPKRRIKALSTFREMEVEDVSIDESGFPAREPPTPEPTRVARPVSDGTAASRFSSHPAPRSHAFV